MNLFIKKKKKRGIPCFPHLATNIVLNQYEIVANKRTGIVMYADAGNRNRTYQMTGQNGPTTPQRHTFTKDGISTIYKQKQIGHFRRRKK